MIEITLPPGFSHDEYWVYDDNGNKSSYGYHRTIAQALAMLQTLTRCKNCTNCADCTDCIGCYACTNISDSVHCDDCHDSSGLTLGYKSTAMIEHVSHPHEWNITLHRDGILQIGCKRFMIDQWLQFSDYRIREMAVNALPFWKRWKPTVQMWYDNHFVQPSLKAQAEQSLVKPE